MPDSDRTNSNTPVYDSRYVRSLFDEMAATYGIVNLLSSFGFTLWWRRCCARSISISPDSVVLDLMTGMGELCTELTKVIQSDGSLIALDLSPVMCRRAADHRLDHSYQVLEADALKIPMSENSVDCIFSTFGLKTFDADQISRLASEVSRVLRPGGQFSFLEISVPPHPFLRLPYMFYLSRVVPVLGRIFLGNPDNYRMLGVYTQAFQNCNLTAELFHRQGLETEERSYFFGCASGVIGHLPALSRDSQ